MITGLVPFDDVADALEGVPYMTRAQGHSVYRHIAQTGARDVLEIGCAHGVSACFMAAAIDGPGRVVTVDHAEYVRHRRPAPSDVFRRAGLEDRIDLVLVEDSSYTWWLKDLVRRRSDGDGNCEPLFDFCYLDGAHNLAIDGLSVILIEKLLRPGGWLLLDDLTWTYESVSAEPWFADLHLRLSAAETETPHVQEIFDLVVRQHAAFTECRVENGRWGWAHKNPGAPRRHEVVETTLPLSSRLQRSVRRARRFVSHAPPVPP